MDLCAYDGTVLVYRFERLERPFERTAIGCRGRGATLRLLLGAALGNGHPSAILVTPPVDSVCA